MALAHCIYCSTASNPDFALSDLHSILRACRVKNARLGISGMLLYENGAFFQVLEGELDVLETLFNTIAADPRHHRVVKIVFEPIAERDFSDWTMAYSAVTRKDLKEIPGLSEFFTEKNSYTELGESRAKILLNAFKDGKWRTSLGPKGSVIRRGNR